MKLAKPVIPLALALLPAAPAQAWNARGHMTVAGVAWLAMKPAARRAADRLLRLNPDYPTWIRGIPRKDRAQTAFMLASVWPDALKERICSDKPACIRDDRYTPADAAADINIGYADHSLRRYWHFKNVPFSPDGTPLKPPFAPNAETQIELFATSLTDPAVSAEARSYDLAWLLHLVGDAHQPLHAITRFTADQPNGDGGGNGVIACPPLPAKCNVSGRFRPTLHGLWDEAIGIDRKVVSARRKAALIDRTLHDPASFLARSVAAKPLDAPVAAWLEESAALAQAYAYADPIGPGKGPYTVTVTYRAQAGSVAEQRIALAGRRMAALLDKALVD